MFTGSQLLGMIPEDTREEVLGRVRQGAGLMVMDTAEEQSLAQVALQEESPAFLAGTGMQVGTLGQGRVVRGDPGLGENVWNPSSAAVMLGWAVLADTYYEKLGRGLLWAGGKEPTLELAWETAAPAPAGAPTAVRLRWRSYPRWFDRRAYQAANFARQVRRFGEVAREFDPLAKSGAEGTLWLDDDLDLIVRNSDWWGPYSLFAGEVIRSVAPPDYRYGFWSGGLWPGFLRGANSMMHWRVDGFLAPHGGPSLYWRWMAQDLRRVFDGLGKLLNVDERTEMQHDGIAMLHSFASAQAATNLPEAGPTYGVYSGWVTGEETEDPSVDWALTPGGKNHASWHRAIRALGLQFNYVTDRMLRLGEFDPDEYRVLILSQCEAIGPQEAEVIRRFVRNGGTVIADVRPGLYDGHCKPLAGSALDDVFGVRHTGNVAAFNAPGLLASSLAGRELAVRLEDLWVNPAVELAGGQALGQAGEAPIGIVHHYGAGQAVLLNFTMNSFPNLSVPDTSEEAAGLLEVVFASAGVQWPLRLLDREGHRMRNLEAVRWQTGENQEVLALYAPLDRGRHMQPRWYEHYRGHDSWTNRYDPEAGAPVRVRLPQARFVTLVGEDSATVPRQEFEVYLRPRTPVFVVLSDQRLEPPTLSPARQEVSPGGAVILQAAIPRAGGLHALQVRVSAPDGTPAPWFDHSVIVGERETQFTLPVAHNEQAGEWSVTVTDLYTDRTAVGRFEVTATQ